MTTASFELAPGNVNRGACAALFFANSFASTDPRTYDPD